MSGSHKPRRSWRHRVCVPHPCNTVAGGMKFSGGVLVGAAGENVGDLIVGGKEALNLPR